MHLNMGPSMAWGWVFMILLVVGIVLLLVLLVRILAGGVGQGRRHGVQPSRARELLDERYARGEIDGAEYDERRRRLEGGNGV